MIVRFARFLDFFALPVAGGATGCCGDTTGESDGLSLRNLMVIFCGLDAPLSRRIVDASICSSKSSALGTHTCV